MSEPQEPPIIEPVPAPEIFVDGYQSTMVANNVVRFTFFSMGHDPGADRPFRRVVLRLAMPVTSVIGVKEALTQLLAQMGAEQTGRPAVN